MKVKSKNTVIRKANFRNMFSKMNVVFFLVFFSTFYQTFAQSNWWNDAVFYEVFVRSFKDSDGDGKGDFNGLIEKLDYLNDGDSSTHNDLGITGIWLMPIQESPSYHGYDVTDYRSVEQDYGTNQDFKEFMSEAHKRGIKVIIDYVMNHTSSQHPWFTASKDSASDKRDWYIWKDVKPTTKGPWGQTVWHTKNNDNFYGIFWSEMPDLNYAKEEVKTEMFDNAKFWLEDMGVDGFRLDAIKYIYEDGDVLEDAPETIQFWKDFRTYYKGINSEALAVGEAWTSTDKVKKYVEGDGLDFCFEFDLASAILNAANQGNASALKTQLDKVVALYPQSQFGTFLTNHDMNRVMNQLGNDEEKAKVAAELLLTLPGVPYIYYGEELGMTGAKPDENIRKPFQWDNTTQAGFTTGTPWRAVNNDYEEKNLEIQQYNGASLWSTYRNLIALRNNQKALSKGNYVGLASTSTSIVSFLRQYDEDNIIIASNVRTQTATDVSITVAEGLPEGNYTLVELQGGEAIEVVVNASGAIVDLTIDEIPAKSTKIYKLLSASDVSTSVRFEVDMNEVIKAGDFTPSTDVVNLVLENEEYLLLDINNDGIYAYEIFDLQIGSKQHYKFQINEALAGTSEFLNGSYLREYTVLEGNNIVKNKYQSEGIVGVENIIPTQLSVFPNPTKEQLSVHFNNGYRGSFSYQLSNVIGLEVKSGNRSSNNPIIPCDELTQGVYLLTLSYAGISEVRRIVIQE